jgi:hypothetical protein
MEYIDKIVDDSIIIQKELHSFIDQIRESERGKKIPYQDLVVIFFTMKLAELEAKIKEAGLILKN